MTLAHRKPNGATFTGEDFTKRITDERMQFGSLGALQDKGKLELAFQFPGSEGDRTYICCGGGWAAFTAPSSARQRGAGARIARPGPCSAGLPSGR